MKPEASSRSQPWNLARRVAFRFLFAYWLLYLFPFPLTVLPGLSWLGDVVHEAWAAIVPGFGEHVLGVDGPIHTMERDSGDTLFAYIQVLLKALVAVGVTVVWSALDRSPSRRDRLDDAIHTWVRYALAVSLISYGMIKVIQLQFPFPSEGRLIEPFGEASPMGLLWTFMGYSAPYNLFTGGVELLGGALLLFRRTAMLGACIAVAVVVNIVMLNFCYDVPVKLFSLHLLAMALHVLAPDARRIAAFFVLGQSVPGPAPRVPFRAAWVDSARPAVKALVIAWIAYQQISGALARQDAYRRAAQRHDIAALYQVETVVEDGAPRSPLMTDSSRWQFVAITTYKGRGMFRVRRVDGSVDHFRFALPSAANKLSMTERRPGTRVLELTYERVAPDHLRLAGVVDDREIVVDLRKLDRSFPLVDRGFHWINEYPLNR